MTALKEKGILETYQDCGIKEKVEHLRLTKMMALKKNMEYLRLTKMMALKEKQNKKQNKKHNLRRTKIMALKRKMNTWDSPR